jgi:hypothetical protein
MGRYAIITNPPAGAPKVLMICDTRTEAEGILIDLGRRGTRAELRDLGATVASPTTSSADG